ncbi:hypothetical protein L207DRAFT_434350 [Hyaloscypha variabilis F]|jgi:hypothetical protein|uniref:Uncharacterized protein n=1 Tax=Hyaloscypha variabilis (strain UAMH 11265 / GT02V1 / F) TaxID=1149755 RepID=A0A2J6RBT1_HYAVF|nr:hypothetical protein L207DRAFT_434350 [Hyaloscypha variabilis F]
MAVLTTSSNPTARLATTQQTKSIVTLISPALTNSLYFAAIAQRLLSTTTLFLIFRAYLVSLFLLQQSYHASQILLIRSLYAASIAYKNTYWASNQGRKFLWKSTESMRKRLFMEFIIFALGGGNQFILAVLWPGWIVIGGGIWGIRRFCG